MITSLSEVFLLVFPPLPAGGLYYYLQRSVEKTAPAHEVAGASLQVGTCDRARRLGLAPGPQMANQRVRVRVRVRLRVRGFWRHFLLPAKSRNPGPTPCGLAIWSPQGPGAVAWINAKEQVALVHVSSPGVWFYTPVWGGSEQGTRPGSHTLPDFADLRACGGRPSPGPRRGNADGCRLPTEDHVLD